MGTTTSAPFSIMRAEAASGSGTVRWSKTGEPPMEEGARSLHAPTSSAIVTTEVPIRIAAWTTTPFGSTTCSINFAPKLAW